MKRCKLCRQPAVAAWLDLGDQALSNRFLRSPDEPQYTHPLALGACEGCGTVQLVHAAPPEEVRPRFAGLTFNEPEGHLDDLAGLIAGLPGLGPAPTVAGLTYKDASTLHRLRERGLAGSWLADSRADLGVAHPLGGVESVQQNLTRATAARLADTYGRPEVVVLRHVLEHAHDVGEALACLSDLLAPGGHLVVEVPDAARALERCDYSAVWEEHVFYFTPATLRHGLALAGLEVVLLRSYPHAHEGSLVAIARPSQASGPPPAPAVVDAEVRRARRYCESYPVVRAAHVDFFARLARAEGKAALLGAGHRAAAFVNLLGLGGLLDFVADDDPRKQGLYMPGSRLPIVAPGQLVARGPRLCLMAVRPEAEAAVARNSRAFLARGGRLASIFPDSPYAVQAA
jgi:hypothetical protein